MTQTGWTSVATQKWVAYKETHKLAESGLCALNDLSAKI